MLTEIIVCTTFLRGVMSNHRIRLLSGGFFDFVDMHESVFTTEDIANNLGKICRFTGALAKHYSVGQHSVICSYVGPPERALERLMHDSSEFVMNDLNSPLKALIPQYKALEKKVEKEIFSRYGLKFPMHSSTKLADNQVFAAENRDLRGIVDDFSDTEMYPRKIIPWSAEKSAREFMRRFKELTE